MKIEQIYTGCLAQGAYYIESNGEAAIIDPLREVAPYIAKAKADGSQIRYVLETHFHADFVSGHLDLARKTGATIVFGPTAQPGFEAHVATDGEVLQLGGVAIKVLHTPGHTMESCCYLLQDEAGKDVALFSGDTLFIGDVGRPDLAQKVVDTLTPQKLAGHLYHSLRNKIMPLADNLIVYPAHGAGSACGKNMRKETTDTLGNQKQTNYALDPNLSEAAFIEAVLDGLTAPPQYFPVNVLMNIRGYDSIDEVLHRGTRALRAEAFAAAAAETGALILDTRNPQVFAQAFIPGSINIGIDGNFAPWVGTLITDVQQQLLIVADEGREQEVVTRLARVGYDHAIGYLQGGFAAWEGAGLSTEQLDSVSAATLLQQMHIADIHLLDVRRKSEYESEHVVDALNAPLDYINDSMQLLKPGVTYHVYCAGGYRSVIFCSILKARGFDRLVNITGGFSALKAAGFTVTDFVHPTTML